jgi:hypothetical protein
LVITDSCKRFFDQYLDQIGQLLISFYRLSTIDYLLKAISENLEQTTVEVFNTRWPFFVAVCSHAM